MCGVAVSRPPTLTNINLYKKPPAFGSLQEKRCYRSKWDAAEDRSGCSPLSFLRLSNVRPTKTLPSPRISMSETGRIEIALVDNPYSPRRRHIMEPKRRMQFHRHQETTLILHLCSFITALGAGTAPRQTEPAKKLGRGTASGDREAEWRACQGRVKG